MNPNKTKSIFVIDIPRARILSNETNKNRTLIEFICLRSRTNRGKNEYIQI